MVERLQHNQALQILHRHFMIERLQHERALQVMHRCIILEGLQEVCKITCGLIVLDHLPQIKGVSTILGNRDHWIMTKRSSYPIWIWESGLTVALYPLILIEIIARLAQA